MNLLFRKALLCDAGQIMQIIREAQASLKEQGIDQWQNGYPDTASIEDDIRLGHGYVLEDNGQITACAAISFDGEQTYDRIYDGHWNSTEAYAVIHRLAVTNQRRGSGISARLLDCLVEVACAHSIHYIRIDTHEDNLPMQRMLLKNQFRYCGVIYLADQSKRLAYDKRISEAL